MSVTYKIQKGDTLSGLAKRFGVTVQELAKSNAIKDPNKIIAGKTLSLPDNVQYKVQRGDTLSAIARKLGTTVKEMQGANSKIKNVDRIYVGDKLEIPKATATESKPVEKKVEAKAPVLATPKVKINAPPVPAALSSATPPSAPRVTRTSTLGLSPTVQSPSSPAPSLIQSPPDPDPNLDPTPNPTGGPTITPSPTSTNARPMTTPKPTASLFGPRFPQSHAASVRPELYGPSPSSTPTPSASSPEGPSPNPSNAPSMQGAQGNEGMMGQILNLLAQSPQTLQRLKGMLFQGMDASASGGMAGPAPQQGVKQYAKDENGRIVGMLVDPQTGQVMQRWYEQ